jgi:hypothetical protein
MLRFNKLDRSAVSKNNKLNTEMADHFPQRWAYVCGELDGAAVRALCSQAS